MDTNTQHPMHPALPYVISALSAIILIGGYATAAKYQSWWPFANQTPAATATPTPSASTEYRNAQYGFSIALPESWKGHTAIEQQWNGTVYDTKGNKTGTDHGPLITLHYPSTSPHEAMPIMVFTPQQWQLVLAGQADPAKSFMSVSAAPIPPSELGHNSKYVFALPARYNYDYQTGWEEVDQLVHTLKTFEPNTTGSWKTYTNTELGFSFKYPTEFSATTHSEGTSPQWRTFARPQAQGGGSISVQVFPRPFDANNIQGVYGKIENTEQFAVGNRQGYGFIEGDAGCGGMSVHTALSNKTLEIGFGACDGDVSLYDDKAFIQSVLSTFTFTDVTTGWKTYTNTQLGFTVNYPTQATVITAHPTGSAITPLAYAGFIRGADRVDLYVVRQQDWKKPGGEGYIDFFQEFTSPTTGAKTYVSAYATTDTAAQWAPQILSSFKFSK